MKKLKSIGFVVVLEMLNKNCIGTRMTRIWADARGFTLAPSLRLNNGAWQSLFIRLSFR